VGSSVVSANVESEIRRAWRERREELQSRVLNGERCFIRFGEAALPAIAVSFGQVTVIVVGGLVVETIRSS